MWYFHTTPDYLFLKLGETLWDSKNNFVAKRLKWDFRTRFSPHPITRLPAWVVRPMHTYAVDGKAWGQRGWNLLRRNDSVGDWLIYTSILTRHLVGELIHTSWRSKRAHMCWGHQTPSSDTTSYWRSLFSCHKAFKNDVSHQPHIGAHGRTPGAVAGVSTRVRANFHPTYFSNYNFSSQVLWSAGQGMGPHQGGLRGSRWSTTQQSCAHLWIWYSYVLGTSLPLCLSLPLYDYIPISSRFGFPM